MFRAKLKTDKTVQAAVSGSGDIVSFESAFEKPLADLALNITPVQSGEGDPSPTNIRPISGWTGANVWRGGKNFCPKLVAQSNVGMTLTVDENGVATLSGESTGVGQVIGLKSFHLTKGTYTMTGGGNSNYSLRLYNEDTSNTIARLQSETASVTFTLDKLTRTRVFVRTDVAAAVSGLTFRPMIRLATDTDATYEPYKGDTYPVTWSDTAGTVYGGMIDPLNGKLRANRASVDMGTLSWGRGTLGGHYFFQAGFAGRKFYGGTLAIPPICSCYAYWGNGTTSEIGAGCPDKQFASQTTVVTMRFRDDDYTDAASFKEAVTGQTVVYELATPIEYDLDPVTINTLLGQNNVWADCGEVKNLRLDAVSGKLKFKLIQ